MGTMSGMGLDVVRLNYSWVWDLAPGMVPEQGQATALTVLCGSGMGLGMGSLFALGYQLPIAE